jgi:transcriptional regulator with XRE-family HTH domain
MTLIRDAIELQLASFGSALRELRQNRNWSLQELAFRSGLSKTFLSRLETGDRQASISAVLTLARIFDVSLATMFETQVASEPCLIVRAAEASPQSVNGLTYTFLSNAERFFNLQPIRLTVSPKRDGKDHYHHDGEEWIYLLSGRLTLSLSGKSYDLEPGDAAHFDSRQPHRLIARGPADAEVLLVASPFSESERRRPPLTDQKRAIPAMGFRAEPFSKITRTHKKPSKPQRRKP